MDIIFGSEEKVTVEYYASETDTAGTVELNPNQLDSLKKLMETPALERVGIVVTDAPDKVQTDILKVLTRLENEDVHIGIIGSTVSLEPLKKCAAKDIALTGCDLSQFPVYDVRILELGYCTGMDWSKLREYKKLEVLSLGGDDLGPTTLADITDHDTITFLDFDLPFRETAYTGSFPVVLESGDTFPEELLDILPYTAEELQAFLDQEDVRLRIRINYFDY